MKNKKISKAIICTLSATSLVSCNPISNKVDLYKVENLESVVKMEYLKDSDSTNHTLNYHFLNSSFCMLVANNNYDFNKINNYVKTTNDLIYYMDLENYNQYISDNYFGNKKDSFEIFNDNNNHLIFVKDGKQIKNVELKNDVSFQKIISKYANQTNLYLMNIDTAFKDENKQFVIENDISNLKIIYDDFLNRKIGSSNFFSKLNSDEKSYVYFQRKTCGDCRNFSKFVVNPFYREHKDKKLYIFDLFIYEYYKESLIYDRIKFTMLEDLNISFNYNLYDENGNRTIEENKSFRFPTIASYQNNTYTSIEDKVVYSNHEITKSEKTNKYYVSKSFYADLPDVSDKNENKVSQKVFDFEENKCNSFLEKY